MDNATAKKEETTKATDVEKAAKVRKVKCLELFKKYGQKSAAIRELDAQGWTKGEIAKSFEPEIRYQHVYNVLNQPLKGEKAATPEAPRAKKEQKAVGEPSKAITAQPKSK